MELLFDSSADYVARSMDGTLLKAKELRKVNSVSVLAKCFEFHSMLAAMR
jgi:hypothetical protein